MSVLGLHMRKNVRTWIDTPLEIEVFFAVHRLYKEVRTWFTSCVSSPVGDILGNSACVECSLASKLHKPDLHRWATYPFLFSCPRHLSVSL